MATQRKATRKTAADKVDEQLQRYRSMREFTVTPEPSGKSKTKSAKQPAGLPFVIQKHAASRLHYDFRLGWNGVLKSWAVTKGPSYFPRDKRLAVQVEDHPIEYGGFEGIIPKGQYGGGTVMVWDQGTWEPQPGHTDVDEGLRSGSLKFILHGKKMKGKWALIRMGGKAASESKPNWLLIKEHDEFERKQDDEAITDEAPDSAVTGRSLDEIASNQDHVWNSKETANGDAWHRQESRDNKATSSGKKASKSNLKSGVLTSEYHKNPKEKLPDFVPPQLAQQSTTAPDGSGWLHELKLDGYRIQARKDGEQVQLLTRTGLDWTHRMKDIAASVALLPADTLLADGEVVVLADDGTTSFADLQAAFNGEARKPLTYFVFDLLYLNGHNLRHLPLTERKDLLAELLPSSSDDTVRLSEHLDGDGKTMFQKACELHAEGIVSKRATGKYMSGRGNDWRKLKCIREQEFVIGGFTLPSNGTHGVGALLLGYYEEGKLTYAGRTGTGFTQKTHKSLRDRLERLKASATAFDHPPPEARRGAIWVQPKLVAQVRFATWTVGKLVRQASFQGLREDKPASEVTREEVASISRSHRTAPASQAALIASKEASPKETAKKSASAKPPRRASSTVADHAPIRLTHPDKILDAESQLTKQQLADYYWAIAPYMLPYISGRPLSLVRCPDGSEKPCFFQKHANATLPADFESVDVKDKKSGKLEPYITLSTQNQVAELAQMGVLEVHPWGSSNDDMERPDLITIDLDPDSQISWNTLTSTASDVRRQLRKLGLESFVKLTGGKGLHVVIPIQPEHPWPVVKQFAHEFALAMEKRDPSLYLTKMSKAARAGRIFIDYLRNERGATAVAAYSPRARAGATVSLPLDWTDLKASAHPVFRVADFAQWRSRLKQNPWKSLPNTKQRLTPELLQLFKVPA
jgi:bifunctional non-homologous end joining protein LigD